MSNGNGSNNSNGKPDSIEQFLKTRPEAMDVCHASADGKGGGLNRFDEAVRAVRSSIGDNVTCIAITVGIVAVSLAIAGYVAQALYRVLANWRVHQLPVASSATAAAASRPDRDDDVRYAVKAGAGWLPPDLGPPPAAAIVAARMQKLSATYAKYNAAVRQHASDAGVAPDDIIDSRILGRADDDWKYNKKDSGGSKWRPGGGPAPATYALRSPVYRAG